MTQIDYQRFKSEINLSQYAAYLGYELDQKKSTRSSIVMRNDPDKVIISRRGNIWVYFSVFDDEDNGTIIDFALNRSQKSLYEIACHLQEWMGDCAIHKSVNAHVRDVEERTLDPERVQSIFHSCKPIYDHAYLEARGICSGLLSSPRFACRVYEDRYSNVVFPHYKDSEICGLELKNHGQSLFVRGSEKTMWRSNIFKGDTQIVIAEAVIDALSYYAMQSDHQTIYLATGGGISPAQRKAIKMLIQSLKDISRIFVIPDNDPGGDKLENHVRTAIDDSGFCGSVEIDRPTGIGEDWNDVYMDSLKKVTH